ncbi:MAG: hypothetical protein FJ261_06345 [Planctomycetes bacterium]|nr:hypothetical protein [Planctomycetota bacterium]
MRATLSFLFLFACASISRSGEVGPEEAFALAKDRAEFLKTLIPGTEAYYFYNCLHLLQTEQADQCLELSKAWKARHGQTALLTEIQLRHAFLVFGKNPKESTDFLTRHLGVRHDHQRVIPGSVPDLPTALDPARVDPKVITEALLKRQDSGVELFEDSALERLAAGSLTSRQRRNLLSRLVNPDLPGLVKMLAEDLAQKDSGGFGTLGIHNRLTLEQLRQLVELRPDLRDQQAHVMAVLSRLRPGADDDWRHDKDKAGAYIDRLVAYSRGLGSVHNSLKAHGLYHKLAHSRSLGVADKALFLEYLALPRQRHYQAKALLESDDARRYPANLGQSFGQGSLLPAIGDDEALVRDLLLEFLRKADDTKEFLPLVNDTYLKHLHVEAKVTAGLGDPETWASRMPPEMFRALRERVDIDFAATSKTRFRVDEPVRLEVMVKNAPTLIVKVFEINAANYYREKGREIDTDINLDGLVANSERVIASNASPLLRESRTISPEGLDKPGVYVIDLIGNGRSSRALIRKGALRPVVSQGPSGHRVTVVDGDGKPVAGAILRLGEREFVADAAGRLMVPFAESAGRRRIVLSKGDFACLDTLDQAAESYALTAGIHADREALLAGREATVVVRAGLSLNGELVSLAKLSQARLSIFATDTDGVPTREEIGDFKLFEDRESFYAIRVPRRLASLTVTLSGKVTAVSTGAETELSASQSFQVNGIQKTDRVDEAHLGRDDRGYWLEVAGRTGETRADRAVSVVLKHREFREPARVSLKSDARGIVTLGPLAGVDRVEATVAGGASRAWSLAGDRATQRRVIHAVAGQDVAVPLMGVAGNPSRADAALLEVRDEVIVADRFDLLSSSKGLLVAGKLPAGDYDLVLKASGERIRVRVVAGPALDGFVLGAGRDMALAPLAPLQISSAARDDSGIVVSLANATKFTRVHVLATRYVPAFDIHANLARVRDRELAGVFPSRQASAYVTGRDIGDEYRYVLDRRGQKKYPTPMVDRPALLLNPWAVRDTATGEQLAEAGGVFSGKGTAPESRATSDPMAKRQAGAGSDTDIADIDYLSDPAAVAVNLVPDKDGVVRVPAAALAGRGIVRVVAVDPLSVVSREVAAPGAPLKALDLRLVEALKADSHFIQRRQVTAVGSNTPFVIGDAGASRHEVYDSVGKVYDLLATLRPDSRFATFRFVATWPSLKPAEKRDFYSRHACHELSVFVYHKDPEFFKAVVAPHLTSKKDKTFVDQWLLGEPLEKYLEPWRHARLNTAEKVLLARRLADEPARTARWIDERVRMRPPTEAQLGLWFDAAVARGDLSAEKKVFQRQAGRALSEAEQHRNANMPKPGFGMGVPGGGALGGIGGGGMSGEPMPPPAAAGRPADRAALARDGANRGREADGKKEMESLERQDERRKSLGEKAAAKDAMDKLKSDARGMGAAAPEADAFFRRDESGEAAKLRALYRRVETTREWAENNYHTLPIASQLAALVPPGRFWADWSRHEGKGPFLSREFASASGSFAEAMLALSVIDLPFTAPKADLKFEGARLTITSPSPMIVVHEEIAPSAAPAPQAPILVSQNAFQANDRYRDEDGERMDKFVTGEFVIHTVYGSQVVVTNTSPSRQKLSVLIQVPAGAVPLSGAKATRSVPVELEAYNTKTIDTLFYFPLPGEYAQFPVHVSKNGVLLASAKPPAFKVVAKPTKVDTKSWEHVSQNGTPEEVLAYLNRENVQALDLAMIGFRLRDKAFFLKVAELLRARHAYHPVVWSYALLHDDTRALGEFLRQQEGLAGQLRHVLASPVVSFDPVERHAYQHLEYKPLVNARAHSLGRARQIVNQALHAQYHALLEVLSRQARLDDSDWLAVTHYLLVQDRVEEAIEAFAKVRPGQVATRLQYDYCAAYLALCQEDLAKARQLASLHAGHPVDRWGKAFQAIIDQLDEAQGKEAKVAREGDRDQEQGRMAAIEPSFDLRVDGPAVEVAWQNLDRITLRYYAMDVELLFSRNPFLQDFGGQFALIKPNDTASVELKGKEGKQKVAIPEALKGRNVLVEVSGGGKSRAIPYYSGSMKVLMLENNGQVAVRDAAGKPLSKVYVKVYAKLSDGRVKFHKDGYTDIRGRFDYASVSTPEPVPVQRYGVLVLSESLGATIRDAAPPAGSERGRGGPVPLEIPNP